MVLKNKYGRAVGHQNVKRVDPSFNFVFSSDIKDWMPKVSAAREYSREYYKLNSDSKRKVYDTRRNAATKSNSLGAVHKCVRATKG